MREAIIEKVQITRKGKDRIAKITLSFQLQNNEENFIAFLVRSQSKVVRFTIDDTENAQ